MRRTMLNAKIHRATVTEANLNYVGSISVDPVLLEAAGIAVHEKVSVLDIDNGARFETYTIAGTEGQICLNGAAARLVQPGDLVIILTYAEFEADEIDGHVPAVVHVDAKNALLSEPMASGRS
jgi:aspartate 1-decarboxylase